MTNAEMVTTCGWCALSVLLYAGARMIHLRARQHPLLNTAVVAAVLAYSVVRLSGTAWSTYRDATRPLALLLGPATVAFAAPVYRRLSDLKRALLPSLAAIGVGSLVAASSAVLIARALGASLSLQRSLAPKSVTTPIAMAVSRAIGGTPELTAGFVIFTGVVGAVAVPWLFVILRLSDRRARGIAAGIAAHGFGTARALSLGEAEGAFAILGMGLSGLFVPLVLPWLVLLLFR